MSASDDYPTLAMLGTLRTERYEPEAARVLAELDALRDDVSKLLAKLAASDATWP